MHAIHMYHHDFISIKKLYGHVGIIQETCAAMCKDAVVSS